MNEYRNETTFWGNYELSYPWINHYLEKKERKKQDGLRAELTQADWRRKHIVCILNLFRKPFGWSFQDGRQLVSKLASFVGVLSVGLYSPGCTCVPVKNVHIRRAILAVQGTLWRTTGRHSSSNNTHCKVLFTSEQEPFNGRSDAWAVNSLKKENSLWQVFIYLWKVFIFQQKSYPTFY